MDANERESLNELAERIIGAAYEVGNVLGPGFLEKVYERALLAELGMRGIPVRSQAAFPVTYKGQLLGDYIADLLVDERIVVELKCADAFCSEHMAQCINYLKASGLKLALLINFGRAKVEWRRVVRGF